MKTLISLFFFLVPFSATVFAQTESTTTSENSSNSFTYGEFKAGYGVTQFSTGLKERFESGNFSRSGGGIFSVAAYRKFKKLNYIHLGLKFKGLGAAPSRGDNNSEMFFNFWGTAFSIKYFPFSKSASKGFYLQGDYNFTTQFTQKYRNTGALEFDHQFAIGSSFTLGLGYQYPLKNRYALVATVEYDWANRQGEVQGIGDKQFRNTNLAFQLGLIF
jgi:hypothetical protein